MMRLFASLFEKTGPTLEYFPRDYFILAAIVAVGIVSRFWGLDNVGLHGDEETMALAMHGLLETGEPILPSGMYYARALAQVYAMAGSVSLFGESAWSLRLPSALVGSLMPLVAFYFGKRFLLNPVYNLAFVALFALLPAMIEISQTARMYVFWMVALMLFGIAIFRWERSRSYGSFAVAVLAFLVALHFHRLSILASPLFAYPGLSNQSWRQFSHGGVGLVIAAAAYLLYADWIDSKYPDATLRPASADITVSVVDPGSIDVNLFAVAVALLLGGVAIAYVVLKNKPLRFASVTPVALLVLGFAACLMLHYHIGGLLLLAGLIMLMREGLAAPRSVGVIVLVFAVLSVVQIVLLYRTGDYSARTLLGAMIGQPSIWPILRFAQYTIPGAVLYGFAVLAALWNIANNRKIPDHFLLAAIVVWAPLLTLGVIEWNIPSRYAMSALPFYLLCIVAGLAYLVTQVGFLRRWCTGTFGRFALAGAFVVLIVNPLVLSKAVNAGYEKYPDHVGAAEFIREQSLSDDAVLIAEDVLQQTYYLGKIDYWLTDATSFQAFAIVDNDTLVDQYTGSKAIQSGQQLSDVLDTHVGSPVYVIGSGENFRGKTRVIREDTVNDVLMSERLREVYRGRDGNTVVWQLPN